jgi:apolipoprotein D and lipocalin family protein
MSNTKKLLVLTMLCVMLSSCASSSRPPIALVPQVDLPRFMGDWYVIAAIPTAIEDEAYNAVESYRLDEDGTIATTFTFSKGSFDGPLKTYTPRGFVVENSGNALWGMQFIWPIKAEYRIVYLAQDYSRTIIARNARDYVWIMARTPALPEAQYRELVEFVGAQGYDLKKLRKVPQRWPGIPANDAGSNPGDKQ